MLPAYSSGAILVLSDSSTSILTATTLEQSESLMSGSTNLILTPTPTSTGTTPNLPTHRPILSTTSFWGTSTNIIPYGKMKRTLTYSQREHWTWRNRYWTYSHHTTSRWHYRREFPCYNCQPPRTGPGRTTYSYRAH